MEWDRLLVNVWLLSGVLCLVLTVVTLVLSQRKSTPDRSLRRLAVVTGVAWVGMILLLCVMVIMMGYGMSRWDVAPEN